MELELNPDIVRAIVQKARIFHAKEAVTFPANSSIESDDFDFLQILADHADDLTYQEAVIEINKLEPDQQIQLVALMYLGRGDYDISEWDQALQEAQNCWTERTGEYLLSRPLVADHLEEGLSIFGYTSQD